MITFRLIQTGLIEISPEEGIKDSRPTSSLLGCDGFRVVIDTEHPKEDGTEYVAAMRELGVFPDDVDCVIFTHLHPDHFGHKSLFTKATFVYHQADRFGFHFKDDRRVVLRGSALIELSRAGLAAPEYVRAEPDLRSLGKRIYIRHAPGHTPGSTMTFALIDGLVHAWVGDIFLNRSYFDEWQPPGSSWEPERIYGHMEYVCERADVIVPGHGAPFRIR